MLLTIKALFGAIIVMGMSMLANTKYYILAGILPLFPTFSLIAHLVVGQKGNFELKNTVLFSLFYLIPYFLYLFSVYLLSGRINLYLNLFISTIVWLISAVVVYIFWQKFFC